MTSIADLTAINLGRDIHLMREVAEKAQVNLIASTGFYYQKEPALTLWDADALVEELLPDLETGIAGTDSRAGIIKCAIDKDGLTDYAVKMIKVAARLHQQTGVPISTHTNGGIQQGPVLQDALQAEGVDLNRVVIGHCSFHTDAGYLEGLMRRGSYIGMDQFAYRFHGHENDSRRIATIAELCRRGWAKRIVLSHDASCCTRTFGHTVDESYAPNLNFTYVPTGLVAALRDAGVTQDQLDQMTIANPRTFLAGEAII